MATTDLGGMSAGNMFSGQSNMFGQLGDLNTSLSRQQMTAIEAVATMSREQALSQGMALNSPEMYRYGGRETLDSMHREVIKSFQRRMEKEMYSFLVEQVPDRLRGLRGVEVRSCPERMQYELRVRAWVVEYHGGEHKFRRMLAEEGGERSMMRKNNPRHAEPDKRAKPPAKITGTKIDAVWVDECSTIPPSALKAAEKMDRATWGPGILWELRKKTDAWLGATIKELKKKVDTTNIL